MQSLDESSKEIIQMSSACHTLDIARNPMKPKDQNQRSLHGTWKTPKFPNDKIQKCSICSQIQHKVENNLKSLSVTQNTGNGNNSLLKHVDFLLIKLFRCNLINLRTYI